MLTAMLLMLSVLTIKTVAFEIPAAHREAAAPVVLEIIECRFDNALRLAETALAADGNNAMAAVMHLVTMGMRDVDADLTIDSAGFMRSFDRARNIVEVYEKTNGVSSYSTMLRGFTLGIHASFHLKNKSYFGAAGTGMDAIKLMREAKELDSSNVEVNLFLGLYEYGLTELKKRLKGVAFWLPGSKQNGIRLLEECAANAELTRVAALLALSDIYVAEKQPQKSRAIIDRLKRELPESRFLLWAEVKYYEEQKMFRETAAAYAALADSYERDKHGAYNAAVTRNKQARAHQSAGDAAAAIAACKRLIARGDNSDKRIRTIIKDTEKLQNRLEKGKK